VKGGEDSGALECPGKRSGTSLERIWCKGYRQLTESLKGGDQREKVDCTLEEGYQVPILTLKIQTLQETKGEWRKRDVRLTSLAKNGEQSVTSLSCATEIRAILGPTGEMTINPREKIQRLTT
jgi:hypothetical protein